VEDTIPIITPFVIGSLLQLAQPQQHQDELVIFLRPVVVRIRVSTVDFRSFRAMMPSEDFISRPNPASKVARVLKMSLPRSAEKSRARQESPRRGCAHCRARAVRAGYPGDHPRGAARTSPSRWRFSPTIYPPRKQNAAKTVAARPNCRCRNRKRSRRGRRLCLRR